jgi:hypothetical protein
MATQRDNWAAVKELFESALEQDPAHRSLFLMERCTDASLRAEVERLLAERDQAGAFSGVSCQVGEKYRGNHAFRS